MSQPHAPADSSKYYLPHGTPWPIIGSVALFSTMLGVAAWLNDWFGPELFALGLVLLAVMFIGWFRTVIGENQQGVYNLDVDRSFRMGMMWFIFSEVMFFAAFFGALFYARTLSVPWIGGEGVKIFNKLFLWKNYDAGWPTNGPARLGPRADGTFEVIPAFGVPALNTATRLPAIFSTQASTNAEFLPPIPSPVTGELTSPSAINATRSPKCACRNSSS